jgi:hypothetical protein
MGSHSGNEGSISVLEAAFELVGIEGFEAAWVLS